MQALHRCRQTPQPTRQPRLFPSVAIALLGLAAAVAQAATTHGATVDVGASASNSFGPPAAKTLFDGAVNSVAPLSFDISTGSLSGQRDIVLGYDGRCVVIATGAACQGGEAPLTTQTILDPNKPITAPVGSSASASASAYARGGSVGARAASSHSIATGNFLIDPANPAQTVEGPPQPTSGSQAQASASIQHTNTLTGLAGSVATITLRGSASSFLDLTGSIGKGSTAFALLQVSGRSAAPGQNCSIVAAGCFGEFALSRYADPNSLTPVELGHVEQDFAFSFQSRVGDIVNLLAYASASTTNSAEADASHTLRIDEIELSDGFRFADETGLVRNGNVYAFAAAVPVPEPQSWAMVMAGLLVIAAVARRRAGHARMR